MTQYKIQRKKLMIFIDGSVNTKTHIGYGAYLPVLDPDISMDSLNKQVKVKRFIETSSTKLELQTLLWALNDIPTIEYKVVIYTDSQNIITLPKRRDRLEQNEYRSKNNRRLNNYLLYQEFYRIIDLVDFKLVKVSGHKVSNKKNEIDFLFTLVDRASRKAMKKDIH